MKIFVILHLIVMKWVFLICLDNINLDDNFDEDDPGNIIYL